MRSKRKHGTGLNTHSGVLPTGSSPRPLFLESASARQINVLETLSGDSLLWARSSGSETDARTLLHGSSQRNGRRKTVLA